MHYANGREAKNGDKVMLIRGDAPPVVGILYNATPGNDFCNGRIAPTGYSDPCPNLKECLHLDDVLALLPSQSGVLADTHPDIAKRLVEVPNSTNLSKRLKYINPI